MSWCRDLAHHHRVYGLLLVIAVTACSLASYYFIVNERMAAAFQAVATKTVDEAPDKLIAAVHLEGDKTREFLGQQVDATRAVVDRQVTAALYRVDAAIATANQTEKDANAQLTETRQAVASIATLADKRLEAIQAVADNRLGQVTEPAGAALANLPEQLTAANKSIAAVATPAAGAIEQVNKALPDFLDCDNNGFGNSDCLQNRTHEIVQPIGRIADSVDKWVERLTAPESWKAQIRDWFKFILVFANHLF